MAKRWKTEFIGMSLQTKGEIEIHEESVIIRHLRWRRDKNFDFIQLSVKMVAI